VFRHLLGDPEENQPDLNKCSRFLGRYLKPAISSKPLYLPQSHWCDWVSEQHGEFIGIDSHQSVIDTYRLLSTITSCYRLLSITTHRQQLLPMGLVTMVQWSNASTGKRWRPIILLARDGNDSDVAEVVVRHNAWYDLCGGERGGGC